MSESSDSRGISRRGFTAALALSGAVPSLARAAAPQQPRSGPPPETPPFEGTIEFARRDIRPKAEPFPLNRVRLLAGIYQDAAEWNRGYVRRLTADRLLYNFRVNAGLPTGSTKPLGGWEQPVDARHTSELRGHFTGHFLSACAQLHASMGDEDAKAKGDEMVAGLARCQEKLGGGYLSAFPPEFFDRLDARKPVWAPFYTIHKIMAGMFDMYRLAGNRQALQVLEGMAAWADGWTASKSEEHMQDILNTEYGGMAETLYNLAAVTNNDRWVRAGDRFTRSASSIRSPCGAMSCEDCTSIRMFHRSLRRRAATRFRATCGSTTWPITFTGK